MIKKRIFTPGPTPIHPEAGKSMAGPALHHRKSEFKQIFEQARNNLKAIYRTENDVLILSCSGTGAMESAVVNLVSPGARVLVATAGKFGERWEGLCRQYGMQTAVIRKQYGESVSASEIAGHLEKEGGVEAVFVQGCESSTGASMNLKAIGEVVSRYPGTVCVVDGITSLGVETVLTDEWNLDVVVGGSQKAFMIPPGLAFVSISRKAWEKSKNCTTARFYFDWSREQSSQSKGQTAFTPAVNLVQALLESTNFILKTGLDDLVANASLLARMARAAALAWGIALFPQNPANAITALSVAPPLDAQKLVAELENRFGAIIAGGQGEMKGKIIRIAHLGYYDALDLIGLLGAIEYCLKKQGHDFQLGSGVGAALQVLAEE